MMSDDDFRQPPADDGFFLSSEGHFPQVSNFFTCNYYDQSQDGQNQPSFGSSSSNSSNNNSNSYNYNYNSNSNSSNNYNNSFPVNEVEGEVDTIGDIPFQDNNAFGGGFFGFEGRASYEGGEQYSRFAFDPDDDDDDFSGEHGQGGAAAVDEDDDDEDLNGNEGRARYGEDVEEDDDDDVDNQEEEDDDDDDDNGSFFSASASSASPSPALRPMASPRKMSSMTTTRSGRVSAPRPFYSSASSASSASAAPSRSTQRRDRPAMPAMSALPSVPLPAPQRPSVQQLNRGNAIRKDGEYTRRNDSQGKHYAVCNYCGKEFLGKFKPKRNGVAYLDFDIYRHLARHRKSGDPLM